MLGCVILHIRVLYILYYEPYLKILIVPTCKYFRDMLTYFRSKAINFFPHILPGIQVMSQLMKYLLSAPINCGTCHQDHVSRHGIPLTTLIMKYLQSF